jgi:hypothetical protein
VGIGVGGVGGPVGRRALVTPAEDDALTADAVVALSDTDGTTVGGRVPGARTGAIVAGMVTAAPPAIGMLVPVGGPSTTTERDPKLAHAASTSPMPIASVPAVTTRRRDRRTDVRCTGAQPTNGTTAASR